MIGILSHCGVPTEVFKNLLEQDLQTTLGVVTDYLDNPILLRQWIAEQGRIYFLRYSGLDYTSKHSGEQVMQEPHRIIYGRDGAPATLHESCVSLLEAGFLPKTNKFLRRKLINMLEFACQTIADKMHICIPKSTYMMCIADHLGILEENEVSIRFGRPFRDEETGMLSTYVSGDVLLARVSFCNILVLIVASCLVTIRYSKDESCHLS